MEYVEVEIKKPLYGSFCYIRDIYISNAIHTHKMLRITIPQGTYDIDPNEWMATAVPMKKVFLQKDNPMTLWGNHVIKPQVQQKKPKPIQMSLI